MKITTLGVVYRRTINLGDYNNAVLEVSIGADLEDSDNTEEALATLWETAKTTVRAQALPLLERTKKEAK